MIVKVYYTVRIVVAESLKDYFKMLSKFNNQILFTLTILIRCSFAKM